MFNPLILVVGAFFVGGAMLAESVRRKDARAAALLYDVGIPTELAGHVHAMIGTGHGLRRETDLAKLRALQAQLAAYPIALGAVSRYMATLGPS
jgi:hypothetical protein